MRLQRDIILNLFKLARKNVADLYQHRNIEKEEFIKMSQVIDIKTRTVPRLYI